MKLAASISSRRQGPVFELVVGIPNRLFTNFELQNSSYSVPELHNFRQSPDLESLKLLGTHGSQIRVGMGFNLCQTHLPDRIIAY